MKSSRTEGTQGWRRKLEKYVVSSSRHTWDSAGVWSHCILWLIHVTDWDNNSIIALPSISQILEEGTEIRRYLWQCLNMVRA